MEQFHAILSGMAASCSFGALESRVLRDVFIVNMTNREAQNELCRATKTPEEAYRITLSYKRGINTPKAILRPQAQRRAVPEAAGFKIKRSRWELFEVDIGAIGEESRIVPGGMNTRDRRCYNCDKPGFTREHMNECADKNVTCKFCRKIGNFERTCRAKRNSRGSSSELFRGNLARNDSNRKKRRTKNRNMKTQ